MKRDDDAEIPHDGALAPALGDVVQPDPIAAWETLQRHAVEVVRRGVDLSVPLNMDPDEYRARLQAARLVLGAQRSALPLPRFGELEARRGAEVIRLRWADGRLVRMPLAGAQLPADVDDDEPA